MSGHTVLTTSKKAWRVMLLKALLKSKEARTMSEESA
jgi:hypothetical protein